MKRYKTPVTIVIAIKCKNGMVVACDSRTTEPSGHSYDHARKLHVVRFADGNEGLVAVAGNDALSSRAAEMITTRARDRKLDDYRAMATCASEAIVELKDEMRKQYKGSADEFQRHCTEYDFELLLAHYFQGKPLIFTADFVLGSVTKRDRDYYSIGCGWILANFFISRLNVAEFSKWHGVWIAAYAVEEIARFDPRCGGPTKGALVHDENGLSAVGVFADKACEEVSLEAIDFANAAQKEWLKTAEARIRAIIQKKEAARDSSGAWAN